MLEILSDTSDTTTVFTTYPQLASYVIITLVTAIGLMWKIVQSKTKSCELRLMDQITNSKEIIEEGKQDLRECYESHMVKDENLLNLTGRVGRLEGRLEGHEEAREDLRQMSENYVRVLNLLPK